MRRINHSSRFIEECYSRYPKQKLGGHISVIRGVSYKPSDVRSSVDEGVAIILRSNNIADGEINFDDLVYVVQERVQNEQKLKPGDIVMCGSNGSIGLVGKAGLLKDNMPNTAFGAFCLGIKCKETILPEYLNTYFNTQVYRNEIESMGNGTNIINIRPDNITNLSIPIPPVEKQMAFVEVVNQADKSKFSDFKSRFIEMFGNPLSAEQKYPLKRLADCVDINPRRPQLSLSDTDQVSFVPMPCVSEEGYLQNVESVDYGTVKKGFTYFEEGDVLFAKITPCMENGKGAIAEDLINGIGMGSTEYHVLREKPEVSNKYWILAFTRLPIFREDAAKNMTGTGGQKRVGESYLSDFRIGLPPIEAQQEFEQLYRQADKSKYLN